MTEELSTIEEITNGYLLEAGFESNTGSYFRHANLVISAVKDLLGGGIHTDYTFVKTVELQISASYTADMPCDYGTWTALGYLKGQRILSLNHDENLTLWQPTDSCGDPTANFGTNFENRYFSGNYSAWAASWGLIEGYRNGEYVGGIFGSTGGNGMGGVKEDWGKKQFRFDTNVDRGQTIMLEYAPSSKGINDQTQIRATQKVYDAIYSYVRYKMKINNDRTVSISQVHKSDYYRLKRLIKVDNLSRVLTLADTVDAFRKAARRTPQ